MEKIIISHSSILEYILWWVWWRSFSNSRVVWNVVRFFYLLTSVLRGHLTAGWLGQNWTTTFCLQCPLSLSICWACPSFFLPSSQAVCNRAHVIPAHTRFRPSWCKYRTTHRRRRAGAHLQRPLNTRSARLSVSGQGIGIHICASTGRLCVNQLQAGRKCSCAPGPVSNRRYRNHAHAHTHYIILGLLSKLALSDSCQDFTPRFVFLMRAYLSACTQVSIRRCTSCYINFL